MLPPSSDTHITIQQSNTEKEILIAQFAQKLKLSKQKSALSPDTTNLLSKLEESVASSSLQTSEILKLRISVRELSTKLLSTRPAIEAKSARVCELEGLLAAASAQSFKEVEVKGERIMELEGLLLASSETNSEISLLKSTLETLRQELAASKSTLDFSVCERDSLKEQFSSLSSDQTSIKTRFEQVTMERDSTKTHLESLVSEHALIKSEFDGAISQLEILKKQSSESTMLSLRLDSLATERDFHKSHVDSLLAEHQAVKIQAEGLVAERDALVTEVSAIQTQLSSRTSAGDALESRVVDMERQISAMKVDTDSAQLGAQTLSADLEIAHISIAEREGRITELESVLSQSTSSILKSNKSSAILIESLAESEVALEDLRLSYYTSLREKDLEIQNAADELGAVKGMLAAHEEIQRANSIRIEDTEKGLVEARAGLEKVEIERDHDQLLVSHADAQSSLSTKNGEILGLQSNCSELTDKIAIAKQDFESFTAKTLESEASAAKNLLVLREQYESWMTSHTQDMERVCGELSGKCSVAEGLVESLGAQLSEAREADGDFDVIAAESTEVRIALVEANAQIGQRDSDLIAERQKSEDAQLLVSQMETRAADLEKNLQSVQIALDSVSIEAAGVRDELQARIIVLEDADRALDKESSKRIIALTAENDSARSENEKFAKSQHDQEAKLSSKFAVYEKEEQSLLEKVKNLTFENGCLTSQIESSAIKAATMHTDHALFTEKNEMLRGKLSSDLSDSLESRSKLQSSYDALNTEYLSSKNRVVESELECAGISGKLAEILRANGDNDKKVQALELGMKDITAEMGSRIAKHESDLEEKALLATTLHSSVEKAELAHSTILTEMDEKLKEHAVELKDLRSRLDEAMEHKGELNEKLHLAMTEAEDSKVAATAWKAHICSLDENGSHFKKPVMPSAMSPSQLQSTPSHSSSRRGSTALQPSPSSASSRRSAASAVDSPCRFQTRSTSLTTANDVISVGGKRTSAEVLQSSGSSKRVKASPSIKKSSSTVVEIAKDGWVYICFSGIQDAKERGRLIDMIKQMPDAEFVDCKDGIDPRITHLISPRTNKTIKILHASLTHKWIITNTGWIDDSFKQLTWANEENFGFKNTKESPFLKKKYYIAKSFHEESKKAVRKDMYMEYLTKLIQEVGEGTILAEDASNITLADTILVGKDEKGYTDKSRMSWSQFINSIPLPR